MIQNNNFIHKIVPGSKLFNKMRKELILQKQLIKKKNNSKNQTKIVKKNKKTSK